MAERKSILVRLQPELYQALQRWAQDEFRSVNGQLEYVLREALTRAGRMRRPPHETDTPPSTSDP